MAVTFNGPSTIPLMGIVPAVAVYDPADANANHAKIILPTGGAVHVPVLGIGDPSFFGVDSGFFNGITQPEFAVLDDAATSYISLGHSAAAVASIYTLTTGGTRTESVSFTETTTTFAGADVLVANGNGFVVGHTAQITAGAVSEFQVLGTALADGSAILAVFAASALAPDLQFVKGRNAAIAGLDIVNDNDEVGRLVWLPADGVDLATEAAVFQAEVDDASPAAGDVGMAFVWESMAGGAAAIAERMRLSAAGELLIANGGALVVGHTAQLTVGGGYTKFQVLGTDTGTDAAALIGAWIAASGNGPRLKFVKSRNGTIGSFTIAVTGDSIGSLYFYGDDGVDYVTRAAQIDVVLNGTIAANRMPSDIVFSADPGGADDAIREAMRLKGNLNLVLGTDEGLTTAPTGGTLRAPNAATGGAGNVAGADLTIIPGLGTGTGDEGQIIFRLPIVAAAGDNIQTLVTAAVLDMAGSATIVGLTLGVAGTTAGTIRLSGVTSGVVTINTAAAAGTWTMTLPPGANTNAGYQLTCAAGDTITTWAAAASLREYKNVGAELDPKDALGKMLSATPYHFRYKPGMPSTGDLKTDYVGVMADEAPWAMHYEGGVINPINTFGYTIGAVQALHDRIAELERKLQAKE